MYISLLNDKLITYDPYGIHRTNGLKSIYLLELMLVFELCSSISHPYFYFFFVPMNCLNAEIVGNTLQEKYLFLFWSILGSSISVFLFGVCSIYKTFFVFFVFFYSAVIYYLLIRKLKNMLPVAPLVLGLASYSLIYVNKDVNFYIALNHFLETMVGGCVMFAGLYLFPNTYYLAIWRRAFTQVITHLEFTTAQLCSGELKTVTIYSGMVIMERYAKMLPREKKTFSILKITLLTFQLVVSMSYLISFETQHRIDYIKVLHGYLLTLRDSIKKREAVVMTEQESHLFKSSHELWIMYKLICSWNHLCVG